MNKFVPIVIGLVGSLLSAAALASQYDYVAVTEADRAARQGTVSTSGGVTWQCKGNRCTTSGPWSVPAVNACAQLAALVGPLRSYGHAGAQLNSAQMRECESQRTRAAGSAAPGTARFGASLPKESSSAPLLSGPATSPPTSRSAGSGTVLKGGVPAFEWSAETAIDHGPRDVRVPGGTHETWTCRHRRCVMPIRDRRQVDDPDPQFSENRVNRCTALAQAANGVTSFRWPGGQLSSVQLADCNIPKVLGVSFSVRSGEDDLRRNSYLTVAFVRRDGTLVQEPQHTRTRLFQSGVGQHLRATQGLDSRFVQDWGGRDLVRGGIERIRFSFTSGKTSDFDSPDNWDMVELIVRAQLQQLDGSRKEVTLVERRDRLIHRFRDKDEWEVRIPSGVSLR